MIGLLHTKIFAPLVACSALLVALAQPAAAQQAAARPAGSASSPATSGTKPWASLSPSEKGALKPLEGEWAGIDGERQRKWLEISKNYSSMTPEQQQSLHSRMTEWAKLSPAERKQARINFVQSREATKALTPEEKKAKWEAYQALSPEEKRKLASTQPTPKGAAVVPTPIPKQRLTTLPSASTQTTATSHGPRIVASPDQVKANTLLPRSKDPAPSKQ